MFSWNDIKKTYQDEVQDAYYGDNAGKAFGLAKVLGMSAVAGVTAVVKNAPKIAEQVSKTHERQLRTILKKYDKKLRDNSLSDEEREQLEFAKMDAHNKLDKLLGRTLETYDRRLRNDRLSDEEREQLEYEKRDINRRLNGLRNYGKV
ncbi:MULTISPECIES: hypothetical protein [unclassified Moraxella]|uniref:hypothetical protein n=1 Tax=unclassified Moraxella TaxID=2685852 RepID=UPI002B40189E|nr:MULTISPECIES: hypothetical protein [unclassified Moraxella]